MSTQLIKPNYLVILPPTQHHSFFRNLPPLLVYSIAWFQLLGGKPSPSDHLLVKSTLAGAQRLLAHETPKKEPITVSQLEHLVAYKADSMASLYNIRSVAIAY